jgi:hypothetical protein
VKRLGPGLPGRLDAAERLVDGADPLGHVGGEIEAHDWPIFTTG